MSSPFRCPNSNCGEELIPVGVSVAWPFGGAEKFYCKKCNKYWWYVEPDTSVQGTGFYLDGEKDPYKEVFEKRGKIKVHKPRRNRLDDFMRVVK